MKKLLALFLSALMLCGFGAGASAQTQEALEAEGRALLTQTMRDLRGAYTMPGNANDPGAYETIMCDGQAYAFVRANGVRDIHFKDRAVRVYPGRNAWHTLSSSQSSQLLPLLTPKEIPAGASIAAREWYGSIEVSYDDCSYWYKDGMLWSIDGGPSPSILIDGFSKGIDPGVFSLDGMREVPELQKWLWEPQEAIARFLDEHGTMNKIVDTALSAGLTALVIAGMPLLYVVVLVLRVLFYFDIYKV